MVIVVLGLRAVVVVGRSVSRLRATRYWIRRYHGQFIRNNNDPDFPGWGLDWFGKYRILLLGTISLLYNVSFRA
jgi:hypothetical protein